VFPVGPGVNPSLTLAALALRLSREVLLPRNPLISTDDDTLKHTIYIANHSGRLVKIWVGDQNGVRPPDEKPTVQLQPGEYHTALRRPNPVPEAVLIYRLNNNLEEPTFLSEPQVVVAHPGQLTDIIANNSTSAANAQRPIRGNARGPSATLFSDTVPTAFSATMPSFRRFKLPYTTVLD